MTFLRQIFSAIMIPVFMVTGFIFGHHTISQTPITPIVQEASTSTITSSLTQKQSANTNDTAAIVDSSAALQKAQQEADNAKIAQQQAEAKAAELQAQQQATQDALNAALAKQAADAEAKSAADAAAAQVAQQQAALAAQQAQQQANQQAAALQAQQEQQAQEEAQQQAAAAQQQKTNQINALTSQYNNQINALNQQIINIKNQYYIDLANIEHDPIPLEFQQGQEQNLLSKDNAQIAQINLQEQQLYINYESQLNALQ